VTSRPDAEGKSRPLLPVSKRIEENCIPTASIQIIMSRRRSRMGGPVADLMDPRG